MKHQTEKAPHRTGDETQEMIASFVKRSTAAQGLPEKVQDAGVLREAARLLRRAS
jgi:hypothetical protein